MSLLAIGTFESPIPGGLPGGSLASVQILPSLCFSNGSIVQLVWMSLCTLCPAQLSALAGIVCLISLAYPGLLVWRLGFSEDLELFSFTMTGDISRIAWRGRWWKATSPELYLREVAVQTMINGFPSAS